MEKSNCLNKFITTNNNQINTGPKYLYKYRPFDQHTFDMIENHYVFLCAANVLDDPSECVVTTDINKYYDDQENKLSYNVIDALLQFIRPFTSEDNYLQVNNMLNNLYKQSINYDDFMCKFSDQITKISVEIDISFLLEFVENISTKINESALKESLKKIILSLLDAREKVGVCSLAESNDIEDMWINYASNYSGYCIEYDMDGFEYNDVLLPVIYENQKETNIVISLVKNILGQFIHTLSNEQLSIDRNQIIKLLTTKDLKWAYQKEWRLVGDADFKLKAPKINRIIIGSNVEENFKSKMIEICRELKIEVKLL